MNLRVEKLTEQNFSDYEKLTSCESGGGCYCSFWHQKITSMPEWDQRKKENPALNRQIVLDKVRTGYHVGVLVYQEKELIAWVSVGPLIDFYWAWKRSIHVGEGAKFVAGVLCLTVAPNFRGNGLQGEVLKALIEYGKAQGWKSIEGYPFEQAAVEKQGSGVLWPGLIKGFEEAGFKRASDHWLSGKDWERAIYNFSLE